MGQYRLRSSFTADSMEVAISTNTSESVVWMVLGSRQIVFKNGQISTFSNLRGNVIEDRIDGTDSHDSGLMESATSAKMFFRPLFVLVRCLVALLL